MLSITNKSVRLTNKPESRFVFKNRLSTSDVKVIIPDDKDTIVE